MTLINWGLSAFSLISFKWTKRCRQRLTLWKLYLFFGHFFFIFVIGLQSFMAGEAKFHQKIIHSLSATLHNIFIIFCKVLLRTIEKYFKAAGDTEFGWFIPKYFISRSQLFASITVLKRYTFHFGTICP